MVFGSARLQEPAAVELALRLAEEQAAQAPDDRIRQQWVAIVKRQLELAHYDMAREFGRLDVVNVPN